GRTYPGIGLHDGGRSAGAGRRQDRQGPEGRRAGRAARAGGRDRDGRLRPGRQPVPRPSRRGRRRRPQRWAEVVDEARGSRTSWLNPSAAEVAPVASAGGTGATVTVVAATVRRTGRTTSRRSSPSTASPRSTRVA